MKNLNLTIRVNQTEVKGQLITLNSNYLEIEILGPYHNWNQVKAIDLDEESPNEITSSKKTKAGRTGRWNNAYKLSYWMNELGKKLRLDKPKPAKDVCLTNSTEDRLLKTAQDMLENIFLKIQFIDQNIHELSERRIELLNDLHFIQNNPQHYSKNFLRHYRQFRKADFAKQAFANQPANMQLHEYEEDYLHKILDLHDFYRIKYYRYANPYFYGLDTF